MQVIGVMMIAVAVRLIPGLLHVTWQLLPGVLALWLVVAVFRSMMKRFLG
jgi:hypothetical protein